MKKFITLILITLTFTIMADSRPIWWPSNGAPSVGSDLDGDQCQLRIVRQYINDALMQNVVVELSSAKGFSWTKSVAYTNTTANGYIFSGKEFVGAGQFLEMKIYLDAKLNVYKASMAQEKETLFTCNF